MSGLKGKLAGIIDILGHGGRDTCYRPCAGRTSIWVTAAVRVADKAGFIIKLFI